MGNEGEVKISSQELVDKYGKLVSSICFRMIQDSMIAEEAAQEVWYEVIKSLDTFQGKSKISTWIYKIAYRVIINYSINEKIYDTSFLKEVFDGQYLKIPDEIEYDERIWIKQQCDKCLTGTLHCLDNENRLAYLFRDVVQLSYEVIAEILDRKEATVRKMVSRSRKKLEKFLTNQCTLYNPEGQCNCRMKKLVNDVNLEQEYKKIKDLINQVNIYLVSEKILPRKNYWEKNI